MNKFLSNLLSLLLILLTVNSFASSKKKHNEPDSAYLFAYNANGLRFAWSMDRLNWQPIGNDYTYLKSDYGRWGSEKKMIKPTLIQGKNGLWVCIWQLNDWAPQFAIATSKNLISWTPQSYPYVAKGKNVLKPLISYDKTKDEYIVTYTDADAKFFQTKTKNLSTYTPAVEVEASSYQNHSSTIQMKGSLEGQLHQLPWTVFTELRKTYEIQEYKARQNRETTKEDAQRFAGLKSLEANISLEPTKAKDISTMLTGIFFEDINYAADGGLYAEMLQNRGFEYHPRDRGFSDKNWNSNFAWSIKGEKASMRIDTLNPIHPNNSHYAVLDLPQPGASLVNAGFDGIAIKKGESYHFSAFLKQLDGKKMPVSIQLISDKKGIIASTNSTISSSNWKQLQLALVAKEDATDVRLEILMSNSGRIAVDMVSLFPKNTYNNRKNGLRADLAKTIADIKPRFVRFPGGCLAHGDGIDNIYNWKNSIGALESRKPDRNLWGYHQTMGLGYFEYFQFCEDIGAQPVPVVAAGVPCQNSHTGGGGQQGGIPIEEMDAYIQDIIDLVEYANGSVQTKWGKKRAEAGHPKPFNLKYIGVGNEDLISEVFEERFTMIYKALQKAHPEITIIGTSGPFFEGSDYETGWRIATDLKVPVIDEHYYQSPGWFINNQDFYDKYDRNKSKVYLGEYAASLPGGTKTNLETSLSEALYLTSLERNGDVVSMASYAPLIAKEGHTQWNPDLIYFNNSEVKPTIGYYVQQLYGQNAGDKYIPSVVALSDGQDAVKKRIGCSIVKDSKTNELIVKLVNMLPIALTTNLNLGTMVTAGTSANKTMITGNPSDKKALPSASKLQLEPQSKLELPAYSFTVLRFKSIQ